MQYFFCISEFSATFFSWRFWHFSHVKRDNLFSKYLSSPSATISKYFKPCTFAEIMPHSSQFGLSSVKVLPSVMVLPDVQDESTKALSKFSSAAETLWKKAAGSPPLREVRYEIQTSSTSPTTYKDNYNLPYILAEFSFKSLEAPCDHLQNIFSDLFLAVALTKSYRPCWTLGHLISVTSHLPASSQLASTWT